MNGLIRYFFMTYIRTHRYVPPVTLFIMMLIINYTYIPNPIMDSYSFTSLLLFFIMGWVTITIVHAEDEGQKQITLIHSKNKRNYYFALIINCIVVGFILSIIAVAYPLVINAFTPELHVIHILFGFLAHFSIATLSIALSIFFTRELVKTNINSWWGVVSILVFTLVLPIVKEKFFNIELINWFIPPLRFSLEIMSVGDDITSISKLAYWQFGWIFIYSAILMVIFTIIVQRGLSK